jgi:enoyl-CoA hydratase/carnithine racemase
MTPVTVEFDHTGHDGLAVVTIDHPPLNLYDDALRESLLSAVDRLEAESPRAVLLRSEGRVVTGGVDVSLFDRLEGPAASAELFRGMIDLAQRIEALPCPTVYAAHALCLTWGFEFALACDLIIAAPDAAFGLIEATVGLTPAFGGTQRLAERAGTGRAREFVMTAGRYSAETLHSWGVVNEVLPADGFSDAALEYAGRLAAGPTLAHAATKAIIRAYRDEGVSGADKVAPEVAGALFDTEDLLGALRSFLTEGHGRAKFTGR